MNCSIDRPAVVKAIREDAVRYMTNTLNNLGSSVTVNKVGAISITPIDKSQKKFEDDLKKAKTTTKGLISSLNKKNNFPFPEVYFQENFTDGVTVRIEVPDYLLRAFQAKYQDSGVISQVSLLDEDLERGKNFDPNKPNQSTTPDVSIEPEQVAGETYKEYPIPSFDSLSYVNPRNRREVFYAGELYPSEQAARKAYEEDYPTESRVSPQEVIKAVNNIPTIDGGDLSDIGFEETYCGL